jgi:hypothetical protein
MGLNLNKNVLKINSMESVNETVKGSKKYSVLYVDAPWQDKDYPQSQIREMAIQKIIAPEALMLMWAPSQLVPSVLIMLGHWGFEFAGMLAWKKFKDEIEQPSMYGECEFMLVGKIGDVKPTMLLRENLFEVGASPGGYKPQGFRRILGHAALMAFGESASYLDVFGAYWRQRYKDYKRGQWDFLEG